MYRGVFTFAGGLVVGGGGTQILYVNVYRVAPPPGGEGYYMSPHLQFRIPVPTFSSAVRCFDLQAVGTLPVKSFRTPPFFPVFTEI